MKPSIKNGMKETTEIIEKNYVGLNAKSCFQIMQTFLMICIDVLQGLCFHYLRLDN